MNAEIYLKVERGNGESLSRIPQAVEYTWRIAEECQLH
jgi:hypothetical protein